MRRSKEIDISVLERDRSGVLNTLQSIDVGILLARVDALRPGAWDIPRFVSTHWRLYQHDAPGGALVLDSGEFAIDPRRVYLIPTRVSFGTRCRLPFRQFYVHFELRGFPAATLHDLFAGPIRVPEASTFEESVRDFSVNGVGSDGRDTTSAGLAREYRLKGIIYEALGRAVESLPADRLDLYLNRLSALEPVLPALTAIRDRIHDPLSNAELAALCFLSRDHFIRKFHAALGVAPGQYIAERRIALAAHRLRYTVDSLEDIAESVGFRNRFYFTRVFTRVLGAPPATYRRQQHP